MSQTATYQLVEHLLDDDLDRWVTTRREAGTGWRPLARALSDQTGIQVSHETLRSWFSVAA